MPLHFTLFEQRAFVALERIQHVLLRHRFTAAVLDDAACIKANWYHHVGLEHVSHELVDHASKALNAATAGEAAEARISDPHLGISLEPPFVAAGA